MTSGNLRLDRGAIVGYKGSDWRIVVGINATSLWLEDPTTHARQQARIAELTVPTATIDAQRYCVRPEILSEKERTGAVRRLEAIRPLLIGAHPREEVFERARFLGIDRATLYRWLTRFQHTGLLSSLITKQSGGAGQSRLTVGQEKALIRAIDEVYMTKQRLPLKAVLREVRRICDGEGIPAPSHNTARARIAIIAPAIRAQRRLGKKAAFRFEPHPDIFPAPQLARDGKQHIDEQLIYASRERRLQIITQATQKTEAARRKFRRLVPARPEGAHLENNFAAPTPVSEPQILSTEGLEPYEVRED